MERNWICFLLLLLVVHIKASKHDIDIHQPLSRIAIYETVLQLDPSVSIQATPGLLGLEDKQAEYVTVTFKRPIGAAITDWIGVFSPASFNASVCLEDKVVPNRDLDPLLCTAPIKYQYANYSSPNYASNGEGFLRFRLINQRADFAFGFFSGDLFNPVLLAVSNTVTFVEPKRPAYPRVAIGRVWNEISVTWTSGYDLSEATPLVIWGTEQNGDAYTSAAGTLTFTRNDMCPPAKTVGWRDPGFIHTGYLKELWPNTRYHYKLAHRLHNGSFIWGRDGFFKAPPFPGEDSLQRVVIFGDMGKAERDGSNEYDSQPAALDTIASLKEDLENIDLVLHIGDISYANGYLSQWDQFTEQIEDIASQVPYMIASGNHERDWLTAGSFYKKTDSGGECGVLAETMFNMPANNKANFWYGLDYGMFHFCFADSEHDWREGTEQHKFIENCLASADRQRQPWLIFVAHRVLGYSSDKYYAMEGSFGEPMGRESLQKLWQKYKVDLAFFGHVHNYERSCPVYEDVCVSKEREHYSGTFNATIHLIVGGAGAWLSEFSPIQTDWSIFKDYNHGYAKLTAFNHSALLFEYKRTSDDKVYDKFWISREYEDVLGCDALNNCPSTTLAS
ncbi:hypothetical protein O6H91_Y217300 [Diphasiastrum complanatum]|nr:hypothetical protein O6H91_Y217300 [Diphasiastrum complanatum]